MDRAKIMNEISAGFNQKYIEQRGMDKSSQLFEQADKHYPVVKGKSDGREVLNHVPNMESISASLLNYKELPKIRDVPLSDFELSGTSYSASENKRIKDLAEQIRQSNKITPLIVVVDADGPYILEGGHRADALFLLGAKSFPAVVVVDLEDNKDISVGAETFNIIFKTASISDEEYMKAVEAGDIQTCKNMINDAAYAAGYTIQAWHGTRSEDKFTIFHDNHNNKQSQAPIGTYFFSGDSDVAYSYSGHSDKVMNVFLKIENPLCFDFQGADWQGDLYGKFEADNDGVIKYFETYEKANDWLIQNGVENPDQYIREDPWVGHSTNSVVLEAKQGGYDGVIMDNVLDNGSYSDPSPGTVYAVFSSSQIKSAEPIVYDNSGNIIPLSQRFNDSSSDIRFEKDSPIITQANFDIIEKTASFGESTIPEGNIRLYHYTRGKANDLLSNGIKLSYSKGDAYGEPNMIWASSIPMTKDKTVIEFTIPANDPALILEYPKQGENIQQWNSGYHHVGILRDIMPKEILAVHEPWSDLYQEMLNDLGFCSRVMSGEFDYITEDKYPLEYKAIQAVKEYMSHKADNENTNVSLLHDLSGVAPDDVEQDEEPILAKSEFDILMTKTASSDEEYMKAVEAGDIDKIQHMVDEAAKAAGYDFAASHGSANHNITIFDGKRAGEQKTSDWTKHGTYFNPGHNSSQYYADEAFQSNDPELKRLMDEEELAAKAMGTTIMDAWIDRDKIGPENYEKLKKFEQAWRSRIRELETMAESGKGGKVYNAYLRIENPYVYQYVGITDPNAGDYAVSHGYDAVVVINDSYTGDWRSQADEIVVFSPDQIKSAEPVTYDDKGNVIPLSRRFDSSNSDIRFRDTAPVITTANFNITIQSPSISRDEHMEFVNHDVNGDNEVENDKVYNMTSDLDYNIVKESSINNSGEIIAYHGTPYKFETFSSEFMGSGEDQLGSGFYFTSNKNNARSFAFKDDNIPNQDNAIFKVKLDIKNPLDADKVGTIPRSKIMQLLKSSPNFKEALSNFGDIEYEGEHNVLKQAVDNYYEHCNGNNIVRGLFAVANDFYSRRPQEFNDAVTKILGYDGVIKRFPKDPFYGDLTHYVVFRPNQIQVLERETQTRTSQSNFDVVVKTSQEEDYRGDHQAPDHTSGYPLHDLSGIYPDDIYGENGARYYGQGNPLDSLGVAIIKAYRGRPNAHLQIYRAVPDLKKMDETIEDLEAQKRFILKYGKLPNGVEPRVEKGSQSTKPISKHYDWLCAEIERRKLLPPVEKTKLSINIGDWVTTVREYAKEHGESTLLGKYKILSKTVYARDLFTIGDSIFEFGYDPQPAVPRNRKQASFDAVIKTASLDDEYMQAAKSGDIEACQRIVNEAGHGITNFNYNGVNFVGNAEITLKRWGESKEVYITGFKSYQTGNGLSLMRQLVKWADYHGFRLIGEVRPMRAEPEVAELDSNRLSKLYSMFGFEKYGTDNIARNPAERITSSAIKLKNGHIISGKKYDNLWSGDVTFKKTLKDEYSHGGIISENRGDLSDEEISSMTPGFITSLGRFVDRKEGAKIAADIGIIDSNINSLHSEDFWNLPAIVRDNHGRILPPSERFSNTKNKPNLPNGRTQKPNPTHLYHGTSYGALRHIKQEGLLPKDNGQVFLTDNETYANSYALRKGNGVMLRVINNGYKPDPRITESGDFVSSEKIGTKDIEVKLNDGTWVPLDSVEVDFGEIHPIASAFDVVIKTSGVSLTGHRNSSSSTQGAYDGIRYGNLHNFSPKKEVFKSASSNEENSNEDPIEFFRDKTIQTLRETGFSNNILSNGGVLMYHGTSARNAKLILRQGKFNGFPFFSPDKNIAKTFASQAGEKPTVLNFVVDPSAILPIAGSNSNYFSARMSGLMRLKNNIWGYQNADVNRLIKEKPMKTASATHKLNREFDSWFSGSKVVDEDGNPLIMHHGTDKKFTVFDKSKTAQGIFWFTSDKGSIERGEAGAGGSGNIMEAYLSIKNPAGWDEYEKLSIGQLFAQGYDGAILPEDGQITCFVFEPNQIRLVSEVISSEAEFDILMTKTASISDEEYMTAAKSNDIESCQKMVNEAADEEIENEFNKTEAKYKFDIITAMSKPSEFILKTNLYHATRDSESGEKILADGFIRPQEHTNKHFLTPVKGMIYSSNSLETAAIYALGGVMMGSDFHESTKSSGQYGYIFMLDTGSMHDVQPDEDSVGEVLSKGLTNYYLDLHHTKLIPNGKAPYWLVNLAFENVAHSRLLKAVNGDYIYYASIGKQLMNKLSDSQKLELIEKYHANVAHNGPVKILKAWKLDKTKSKQISRDGSNVLQIAEEIPVSFGEMKTASFDIITKIASSSDEEYMKFAQAGDIKACQRMVNEAAKQAGYNIGPVYHGTNQTGLTVFHGGWWSESKSVTREFGSERYTSYLRLENPVEDHAGLTEEKSELHQMYEEFMGETLTREEIENNRYDNLKDAAVSGGPFTEFLKNKGYDGTAVWDNSNQGGDFMAYVPFSPSQIKSAEAITYDNSGSIIPLSQRFNSSSSDIRFEEDAPIITTANSKMTNDERTFYRGTVPGETRRIKEPFDAAHGKTFASRKEESARNYGSDIETIVASPNAKILREEDPTFWRLIGRRRPANGYIGSALRNGETVIEAVNDAIRKAEQAGYDIISFSSDTDIGTVILNEASVTRQSKTNSLSSEKNEPSDDLHKDDFQIITIANFNIDLNDKSKKSIENTPGAKITENGLEIEVERNQHRDQAGTPSARSGVFYQPSGSYRKYPYLGKGGYGGLEKIKKILMLKNPIFVKGATGGKAPQMAYDSIMGKGAYERMRMYILNEIVFKHTFQQNIPVENIALILDSYGGDSSLAERIKRIFEHQKGNGLVYAISENIVANVVRKAGYDSIIGYSTRKDGTPFLSEVFNLNEQSYPKKIEQQASYATPNTNEEDKYQSIENYMSYRDEAIMEFLRSFKSHKSSKKWLVPWNLIPAARLIKIWNDYAKLGFVRDEKGMDSIAQQMIKNVARLDVTNSISGHDMIDMREEAEEMYGYKFTDRQWNKFIDGMEDEKGNWRVSDYGLPQLSNLAFKLGMAQTAEQQLIIVDQMLNITHQRGDLAAQFIEGGEKTLNQLFLGGTTEASIGFDKIHIKASATLSNDSVIEEFKNCVLKLWDNPHLEELVNEARQKTDESGVLLGESDGIKILLVNGNVVKQKSYMNFVEGGHDLVYGKGSDGDFIPDKQVWLDANLDINTLMYVVIHELIERHIMDSQDTEYEDAHDQANDIEQQLRSDGVFDNQIKNIDFQNIQQPDGSTCGHTCLAMMLQFLGIEASVEEIKKQAEDKENSEGLSPNGMIEIAKHFGAKAIVKRNTSIRDVVSMINDNQPVIVELQAWPEDPDKNLGKSWDDGHYVVAVGHTTNHMIFEDPSSPIRTFLSFDELEKRWHDNDYGQKNKQLIVIVTKNENDFDRNKTVKMGSEFDIVIEAKLNLETGVDDAKAKGHLDTQLFPNCAGTKFDRDIVKKHLRRQKNLLRKKHLASENMSPEEIEKIQNDLIDEFNAEYDRKWTEVKSSAIRAVSFDEANGKLEVMMKNFKVYSFMHVSKTDFDEFLLSQSKGKWLVNFIAKRKQSKNQKTATVKWGTAGSGVLYYCQEDQTILLLKRSLDVLDPNMWGIPGGAVKGTEGFVDNLEKAPDFDEETLRSSADKEVEEEIGHLPDGPTLIKSVTIQFGSFKYTTFLMGVTLEQKNNITTNSQLNWESTKLEWFNLTNLPKNLHPGVKSAIEKLF